MIHRLRRLYNLAYAALFGYFWLPCPICKEKFGGHEWKVSWIKDQSGLMRLGVCENCSKEVYRRNEEAWQHSVRNR